MESTECRKQSTKSRTPLENQRRAHFSILEAEASLSMADTRRAMREVRAAHTPATHSNIGPTWLQCHIAREVSGIKKIKIIRTRQRGSTVTLSQKGKTANFSSPQLGIVGRFSGKRAQQAIKRNADFRQNTHTVVIFTRPEQQSPHGPGFNSAPRSFDGWTGRRSVLRAGRP